MADLEALLRQVREANEKLVVATVNAERLADETEVARASVAASEERFRSLVLASSTIVWRADDRGNISPDRDGWFSFTGLAPHEPPRPHDWLDAVHPDDRATANERWREAVATSALYIGELRLRLAGGGHAWIAARGVPILANGVAREWIGTFTDISERVELEQARDKFIAILGHDLRGPLAAISISAEALKTLALQPPFGELIDEVAKATQRMGGLVHDLMDFARTRLGAGIPIVAHDCNLGVIAAEIVGEVVRVHPERAVTTSSAGDLRGHWDAGRLGQVVANLLANAIGHGDGPIELSLLGRADAVELAVTNHGPMIHADDRARLFDPFAHGAGPGAGLGLGLYIVSEIVRGHGGTVRVTSDAAETVFSATLPRRV